ncbi:MAG: PQQ-binding-like beta-propeller repeat protein [Pirellulales bacterium]
MADGVDRWWQFRGPNGTGIAALSQRLPSTLEGSQHMAWQTAIPLGHSSPIVVEDKIVVTGYVGNELLVLCLSETNGKVLWQKAISVPSFEKTHPLHGPASSTPASDGQRIFAAFGSFGILCYDLDGNELWKHQKPLKKNMFGSAASPIVHRDRLIVYSGNEEESVLESLDAQTGKLHWARRRTGAASSWSTPVIRELDDISEILFYEPFHLRAVDWEGKDRWSVPKLADEPITVPQLIGDVVITTSYNLKTNAEASGVPTFAQLLDECDTNGDLRIDFEEAKRNKSILSRPDADGQGDHPLTMFLRLLDENKDKVISESEWPRIHLWMDPWEHSNGVVAIRPGSSESPPELVWQQSRGVPECPSPIVIQDHLLIVRNGGVVTAINTKNGQVEFQERLSSGGPHYASPILADEKLFLASARGDITILSTGKWPPTKISSHAIGEPIYATPAISHGGLIVRSEKTLWKFVP